ncbi:transporter family-2 protein [Chitinophaga dinghuensis]|uniref:Transporter family-2 protein n=1 Tax=Chitinophaga dinghuensis TaxID=1539050 RepID=A0A327WAW0_9BACT|nr:DMT family transporter [Chitinophaga dinghuensis]RAJ83198.1 transporter family-2 protein [Chitinophaga dinghuensis]
MNQYFYSTVAFLGGIFLALQAGFNAQLGTILKKPILASISQSISSLLFATVFFLLFSNQLPSIQTAKQIPWYLWFISGLFSVTGITLYYITIPKLGMAKMISLGLCGQLLISALAGHFGWLGLPVEAISWRKTIGIAAMLTGIILINSK